MNTQNKLTRDEILNMPAGREMDILMIDIVGGGLIDKAIHYNASMGIRYAIQDDGVWKFQPGLAWLWSTSTEIAAAWEVVDKFYSMKLDKYSNGSEWRCYIVGEKDGKNADGNSIADTAPLAICRAALLAVME
jgi:ABA sandwich protein